LLDRTGAASAAQSVVPLGGVPATFADTGARDRYAAAVESAVEPKVRMLLGLGAQTPVSVEAKPLCGSPCATTTWMLVIDAPVPVSIDRATVAFGPGRLSAAPVVAPSGACGAPGSTPWISDAGETGCASVGPTLLDVEVTSAVGDPGPESRQAVISASPTAAGLLASWSRGHPGVDVALVLDGRVIGVAPAATVAALDTTPLLDSAPLSSGMAAAVAAALTPPAVPHAPVP
jgi:hypothetical protein